MADVATLLRQVFGDSSDDDADDLCYVPGTISRSEIDADPVTDHPVDSALCGNPRWDRVKEIKGLWICRDFLSHEQQLSLLSSIQSEGWFAEESHNQAMRFGNLPSWVNDLCCMVHSAVLTGDSLVPILPLELLEREPLFDQLIANLYHPGEGICAHVDLMRFDDGIAVISLESPCIMHFSPAAAFETREGDKENHDLSTPTKVPVYLNPGSLVLMSGEARYSWKHEINRKPGFQVWNGQELEQRRRISLTLRKLVQVS